jgi:hypothetical protein
LPVYGAGRGSELIENATIKLPENVRLLTDPHDPGIQTTIVLREKGKPDTKWLNAFPIVF